MLLLGDRSLDDSRVVCIWNQADDKVMLCDLGLKRRFISNIERDWVTVL